MRLFLTVLIVLTFVKSTLSVTRDVYDGVKKCKKKQKIRKRYTTSISYSAYIDESSEVGEKGHMFEQSIDRTEVAKMTRRVHLGLGEHYKAWELGLLGVCVGAKVKLVAPPEEAYGDEGHGEDVPAGATIRWDIEVIDVSTSIPPEYKSEFEKKVDADNSGDLDHDEI